MNTQTTAKDFFLYLGILITLYSGVGFLLNLLFGIINNAYPPIDRYWSDPSISFPVAALIVLTPVFLWLSYLVSRSQEADSEKRNIWVRRWFIFLTVFGMGALVVGDIITLLYFFIDGRDLTAGFLLKILSVFTVAGVTFRYYLAELRNTVSHRKAWRIGTLVGVLAVIALALTVIGSPEEQRMTRYDNQKVSDLQNIQSQILSNWQQKEVLPSSLEELNDSFSHFTLPNDSQSGEPYEYAVIGDLSFRLCADFNLPSDKKSFSQDAYYQGIEGGENWRHSAGHACFERTIDPELYSIAKPIR